MRSDAWPIRELADAAILVDVVDRDGRLVWMNAAEAALLQRDAAGVAVEDVYADGSAESLRAVLAGGAAPADASVLWLRTAQGREVPVLASLVPDGDGGLVVLKQPAAAAAGVEQEIGERVEILTEMIGEATDACWCIEFLVPVDTTMAEDDVVDAVFGHPQRWRACNEAMARLYGLPPDLDFNDQPVSRYFPRSPVNEGMVRALIRAGYRLDRAVAVDHRHDGEEMLVENDFRAAIRGDRLVRLWGTVRDIGPMRRREEELEARADVMLDVLSAVPDPILVVDADGLLIAANPAVERLWGWPVERLLGAPVGNRLDARAIREAAETGGRTDVVVAGAGTWRIHAAPIEGTRRRFVATARPVRARRPVREAAE
ncbi:PAS domain-containing protein [Oharaeibacter diazotrophicus]|uniref:PAS domain-containing protein n=2 Tax=Oharaeibacter diazotrophicus TaxID=1920512 RepID=A0A4V3CVX7_9HYPH|nr:PAS domain-containing protein [Oharaeibacter diazotrophicus]TDP84208.1 PAS domain-containing protein [Oharaeibacter diazotrophicus]BBE73246.1 PAS fold protein [Pleomorphomonas sp. SM30]GLS75037.1 hypothetical protein GCM10007904_03720 [Oharaeibacter diazotrophicus]